MNVAWEWKQKAEHMRSSPLYIMLELMDAYECVRFPMRGALKEAMWLLLWEQRLTMMASCKHILILSMASQG